MSVIFAKGSPNLNFYIGLKLSDLIPQNKYHAPNIYLKITPALMITSVINFEIN